MTASLIILCAILLAGNLFNYLRGFAAGMAEGQKIGEAASKEAWRAAVEGATHFRKLAMQWQQVAKARDQTIAHLHRRYGGAQPVVERDAWPRPRLAAQADLAVPPRQAQWQ